MTDISAPAGVDTICWDGVTRPSYVDGERHYVLLTDQRVYVHVRLFDGRLHAISYAAAEGARWAWRDATGWRRMDITVFDNGAISAHFHRERDGADDPALVAIDRYQEAWEIASDAHARAVERFGVLCMLILTEVARGEGLRTVLQLVGDALNACDGVDQEVDDAWNAAMARITAREARA